MDITPPGDCILDGFAARDHAAEGIHDSLYATALVLSRNGENAAIVGIDLLELIDDQVDTIRRRVKQHYGLRSDRLFLNCSHTHAAPMIRTRFNRNVCPEGGILRPDEEYIERMLDGIVEAVGKACDNLFPARASWGIGETHIGICRRAHDKSIYKGPAAGYIGIYANIPNPHKDIDRTCSVLLITDTGDRPKALLFGAGCHPTTMSHPNYLVSAEYPGAARGILEREFDGALALFIQGIGADVKPARVALDDSFRSGTFDDVASVGGELAEDVLAVFDKGLSPLDVGIRSAGMRFPLPFTDTWGEEMFRTYAGKDQSVFRQTWANMWLKKLANGEPVPSSMDLALSILELSPDLRLLGIAGELLTDMGLKIKRNFNENTTLPCGYTNGRIGYIPDSEVLREGGYEATETVLFTNGMPAPWREDIDDTILGAFEYLRKNIS